MPEPKSILKINKNAVRFATDTNEQDNKLQYQPGFV